MSFDKKELIAKLMEIKEEYFQMIEKKYEEIENLQEEIRKLENRMKGIDKNTIFLMNTFILQCP